MLNLSHRSLIMLLGLLLIMFLEFIAYRIFRPYLYDCFTLCQQRRVTYVLTCQCFLLNGLYLFKSQALWFFIGVPKLSFNSTHQEASTWLLWLGEESTRFSASVTLTVTDWLGRGSAVEFSEYINYSRLFTDQRPDKKLTVFEKYHCSCRYTVSPEAK